jgi:hypothetical protein
MSHSPRTCITVPLRLTGTKCVLQIHVIWCSRAARHTGRESAGGQRQVGGQNDEWGKTSQQANRQKQPHGDGPPAPATRARVHPAPIFSEHKFTPSPAACTQMPYTQAMPAHHSQRRQRKHPSHFFGSACRLGTRVCCYPTRLPAQKKKCRRLGAGPPPWLHALPLVRSSAPP